MKRFTWQFLIPLALPLSIGAAHAAKPIDPDSLPKIECSELKFSPAFLDRYPKAPAACVEAREYKGKRYGKFIAKVYISDPAFMTVQLLNPAGEMVTAFSFKPGPDQRVHVNGKAIPLHDMQVGEKLTFWVSEDRMEAAALPGPTKNAWAVIPPQNR
jgi:hypothetical protein